MSLAISILVLKSTKHLSVHFTALSRKLLLAHLVLEQKHQPNNQRWTDNESRAPKHLKITHLMKKIGHCLIQIVVL